LIICHSTSTTPLDSLSLHDALPISARSRCAANIAFCGKSGITCYRRFFGHTLLGIVRARRFSKRNAGPPNGYNGKGEHHEKKNADRKSTRLNSSHVSISYAVFCLKK